MNNLYRRSKIAKRNKTTHGKIEHELPHRIVMPRGELNISLILELRRDSTVTWRRKTDDE